MRRITKQNILSAALVLPVLLTMLLPAGAASLEAEPKDKRESVHSIEAGGARLHQLLRHPGREDRKCFLPLRDRRNQIRRIRSRPHIRSWK